MTRAEFDSRYRLGDRIAEGGVLSYRAHDLAAGREVTVHLLTGTTAPEAEHLRGLLLRLGPPDRALVLAETEVEGIPVVVTEALPGFTTLPAWLEARLPNAEPESAGGMLGEFTRVFGSRPPEPVVAPMPPPRPIPTAPQPPAPPVSKVGNLFAPEEPPRAQRPVIRLGGSSPPGPGLPTPPTPTPPFQVPGLSRRTEEGPLFSNDLASSGPKRPWSATPFDDPAGAPPLTSAPLRGPADIAELIAAGAPRSIGQRQAEPGAAHSDPASASLDQPPERRSYLPLVLILTALLLGAVGLVVYFAVTTG